MENKEIVRKMKDIKAGITDKETVILEKYAKLLIFHIKQKKLAFYADQIKEILIDVPIFFIPFVPPYIRGFINRHGEPYTVFDMNVLFEKEKLEGSTFLILNTDNDQIAFLISDIQEIKKIPEREIHHITSINEQEGFFKASVTLGGDEIFVLNLPNIIGRLDSDLEMSG